MPTSIHRIIDNLDEAIANINNGGAFEAAREDYDLQSSKKHFLKELISIREDLSNSIPFDIGDLENVRSSDRDIQSIPNLPFAKTYLETKYEGMTYGCLLQKDGDLLTAKLFRDLNGRLVYSGLTIMYEQSQQGVKRIFDADIWGDDRDSHIEEDCLEVDGFVMCLHIINCSNIHYVDHSPLHSMNKKRVKKGRCPLFTYKTLHVSTEEKAMLKSERNGSRQSPRAHLRRGHIRRLKDKSIWIQPCFIKGDGGFVHKDYAFS